MVKIRKVVLGTVAVGALALFNSGCSALQETLASQTEIPSVENQVNRAALGMAIVRENHVIANKMPISADAEWPTLVNADISDEQKQFINQALMYDPYYATKHYSEPIQRQMLGSGALMTQLLGDNANLVAMIADQTVSPLAYRAVNKLDTLFANPNLKPREQYATDEEYIKARTKNWPDMFDFEASAANFLDFRTGKIREIEATSGDFYPTIGEAVIALAPVNMQKDLESANKEMNEAFGEVASLESQKGELEAELKRDEGEKQAEKMSEGYAPLSDERIAAINEEIAVLDEKIKEAESIADEKERIYFELLDQVVVALESEMNVDDENYVKLAKNVNIVADEIQVSATEAYTAFGLATTNLLVNNAILKFPTELASLGLAKVGVPLDKQSLYDARVARLVKNALAALPNALMGTYYANKQSSLAEKYEDVTSKIIVAYETKMEQEKAAAEAEAEAAEQSVEEKAEEAQVELAKDTKQ